MVKSYEKNSKRDYLTQLNHERQMKNEYSWLNVLAGRKYASRSMETYNTSIPEKLKNKPAKISDKILTLTNRFYKAKRLNMNLHTITIEDLSTFLPFSRRPWPVINTKIVKPK